MGLLKKYQKGKTLNISDPEEFALRNAMYDDSLKFYNSYKNQEERDKLFYDYLTWEDDNTKIDVQHYKEFTPFNKLNTKEQKDWIASRPIYNTYKGKPHIIKPIGINRHNWSYPTTKVDLPFMDPIYSNYTTVYTPIAVYKKPTQPVRFIGNTKPINNLTSYNKTTVKVEKPKVDAMPMRPIINRPTQFLPKIDTSSKIEYNPLPTSSSSQTVLQYDPKTGKHFKKAIRVQPDAFFYTGNEWQDNSKPVIYYNPETKEYSEKPNYFKFKKGGNLLYKKGGSDIKIDPKKKGTFKSQATKMGMGVQKAAETILKNKEKYSPAMVKKANFTRNFAK